MASGIAGDRGADRVTPSDADFEQWIDHGIIGRSPALRNVLKQFEVVAPTPATVLIWGETGTGKELLARALHARSARGSGPFVACNCAAIPAGLVESELFGHEKGAYTSAAGRRIGRFEHADHGTIFLDEVEELPLELQPKLLRFLQEGEFERLGSSRSLRVDTRIVAATNVNLHDLVDTKRFRADLFYRLNVFPIRVPPLRERKEDIPLLATHFVVDFSRRLNRSIQSIPSSAMQALVDHDWPGNIRELQNLIERAVILSTGGVLELPEPVFDESTISATDRIATLQTLQEVERAHILRALRETNWILAGPRGAAQRLGVHRSTLQFRMKKLGIVKREPAK